MFASIICFSCLLRNHGQVIGHESRTIEGWTVSIRSELLEKTKAQTDVALVLLRGQLAEIKRLVPAKAVAQLQKVHLWISPEYPGVVPRAEYHPSAGWLREHGRYPQMEFGVEITNVRIFEAECRRMPFFILHELAHAYHDQVLGFDNKRISAAYEHAKASGKYDNVLRWDGKYAKAYAMTNAQEYFAEGTESYFGKNDFYPFDRADLQVADPGLIKIMEEAWTDPDKFKLKKD